MSRMRATPKNRMRTCYVAINCDLRSTKTDRHLVEDILNYLIVILFPSNFNTDHQIQSAPFRATHAEHCVLTSLFVTIHHQICSIMWFCLSWELKPWYFFIIKLHQDSWVSCLEKSLRRKTGRRNYQLISLLFFFFCFTCICYQGSLLYSAVFGWTSSQWLFCWPSIIKLVCSFFGWT